jgi:hypothetical protein
MTILIVLAVAVLIFAFVTFPFLYVTSPDRRKRRVFGGGWSSIDASSGYSNWTASSSNDHCGGADSGGGCHH